MCLGGKGIQRLLRSHQVRPGLVVAVLDCLQNAGQPDLEEFIQVAGRNREELYPIEQRVGAVLSFLEHAPIEAEP